MNPHRLPGDVLPDGPAPLGKGPAKSCPACGLLSVDRTEGGFTRDGKDVRMILGRSDRSPLPMPLACTPNKRLKLGWFRRCAGSGRHLHESCKGCGNEWLTAFADEGP